ANAKLQHGDEIVAVNGEPIKEADGLALALSKAPVGERTLLKVRRDDGEQEVSVLMSKYPISGQVIATNRPKSWRGLRVDFTSMLGDRTFNQRQLEAMTKGGVGVVEVESG